MTALFPELMVQENGETVHFKIKVVSTVVEDRKIPFLTPYPDANPELSDMISALKEVVILLLMLMIQELKNVKKIFL